MWARLCAALMWAGMLAGSAATRTEIVRSYAHGWVVLGIVSSTNAGHETTLPGTLCQKRNTRQATRGRPPHRLHFAAATPPTATMPASAILQAGTAAATQLGVARPAQSCLCNLRRAREMATRLTSCRPQQATAPILGGLNHRCTTIGTQQ